MCVLVSRSRFTTEALAGFRAANELGKVDFRQRCVARIKLRQQYMKMLYWAAEGNSDSLRDAIAVLSLQLSNCGLLAVSDAASTASTGLVGCCFL